MPPLEDIAEQPYAGAGRLSHIYAEHGGQRFYQASGSGNRGAPAGEWRKTFPAPTIYVTDRADGTSTNRNTDSLADPIKVQDGDAVEAGMT